MAADPRFHPGAGPLPLAQLARVAGIALPADAADRTVRGVAPLHDAGPEEVAFHAGKKNLGALRASRAGAIVVAPEHAAAVPEGSVALVSPAPVLAYARIATLLHPPPTASGTRHPTAVVEPGAEIGEGCEIGPYAVIGAGARLGADCIIGPHASVGPGCVLGAGCRVLAHASLSHCLAGDRVTLHPGARVGNEGFGFQPDATGTFVTIPQLGRVILGDGVEIGANACVDRGSIEDTVIGPGTRVDNLAMLGHNVRTGRGCVVVAQVGISGSVVLGDFVTLAGQAGVRDHVTIGSRARVGAQAGVIDDIPPGQDVFGTPAIPVREALRASAMLRRLARDRNSTRRPGGTDGTE
ncbi:UDP-3-O-(3-hydroxymyristoyl)glucosamine N-acyltransferase [Muricoccus radiodurans]|uniref:UDP-3-O-(3-hydroxymyristoyl)glucosamine N-acyltransferase n=1 Tax=Muricoccus radiodurans TaxID=2231721 RepID=UPI003CE8FD17